MKNEPRGIRKGGTGECKTNPTLLFVSTKKTLLKQQAFRFKRIIAPTIKELLRSLESRRSNSSFSGSLVGCRGDHGSQRSVVKGYQNIEKGARADEKALSL